MSKRKMREYSGWTPSFGRLFGAIGQGAKHGSRHRAAQVKAISKNRFCGRSSRFGL